MVFDTRGAATLCPGLNWVALTARVDYNFIDYLIVRYSLLFIANCSLSIVHCKLFVANCSLPIVHCSLFIANCSLSIVHCKLFVNDITLSIVHSLLNFATRALKAQLISARGRVKRHPGIYNIILLKQAASPTQLLICM